MRRENRPSGSAERRLRRMSMAAAWCLCCMGKRSQNGARPAAESLRRRAAPDEVVVRAADRSCVEFPEGEERPRLMLDRLPEERVPFAALSSPDSRILTRLTPARLEIIRKLRSCG